MRSSGETVVVPLLPGRKVWTVSRGEIFPMKVVSVDITESGIFITILYDGDDERNYGWNISQLTEKDEGYLFFLNKADAEKAMNAGRTL